MTCSSEAESRTYGSNQELMRSPTLNEGVSGQFLHARLLGITWEVEAVRAVYLEPKIK